MSAETGTISLHQLKSTSQKKIGLKDRCKLRL